MSTTPAENKAAVDALLTALGEATDATHVYIENDHITVTRPDNSYQAYPLVEPTPEEAAQ